MVSDLILSDQMLRIPQGVFLMEDQNQIGAINTGPAQIRYDVKKKKKKKKIGENITLPLICQFSFQIVNLENISDYFLYVNGYLSFHINQLFRCFSECQVLYF